MFCTFKLSFGVDILAFFGFATVLATFQKNVDFINSSDHPAY